MSVSVFYYPVFRLQLESLVEGAGSSQEMANWLDEVMALVNALETVGRDLDGSDASHPIVTCLSYDAHCLRRFPAHGLVPSAVKPPTLRLPYVWFKDSLTGGELAVVFMIGDKTKLGNRWYPPIVERITSEFVPTWCEANPTHIPMKPLKRRKR